MVLLLVDLYNIEIPTKDDPFLDKFKFLILFMTASSKNGEYEANAMSVLWYCKK